MSEYSDVKSVESEDMYLKAIYLLSQRKESIRAVDISNELCVTQSAVFKAERKLVDDGYITLEAHKRISLILLCQKYIQKDIDMYRLKSLRLLHPHRPAKIKP